MTHTRTTPLRPLHDRVPKRGDRILFDKYSGSEVKLNGEEFLIMKEEDVLGILGVPGKDGHRA